MIKVTALAKQNEIDDREWIASLPARLETEEVSEVKDGSSFDTKYFKNKYPT
jgi:hypothetical protein